MNHFRYIYGIQVFSIQDQLILVSGIRTFPSFAGAFLPKKRNTAFLAHSFLLTHHFSFPLPVHQPLSAKKPPLPSISNEPVFVPSAELVSVPVGCDNWSVAGGRGRVSRGEVKGCFLRLPFCRT